MTMTEDTLATPAAVPVGAEEKTPSTFSRVAKYTGVRLVGLFFTVIIGVYLTILIANMGGYVDDIRRGEIRETVSLQIRADPSLQNLEPEQRTQYMMQQIALQEKQLGLDRPFVLRSVTYLGNALTLNLGRAERMTSDSGSRQVRLILLERLPPTLILFATENFILFFLGIFIALALSRKYGSLIDRLTVAFTPTSSAPAWFYGIFLILIFAGILGWLPFGGMVKAPPPSDRLEYALSVLRHMLLPITALLISSVFLTVYNWRTFFLIYSSEDYVEMAQAKGLSSREIERRYVLRPTLPTIITSFALSLIALWTGAIILETVFNWPGIGRQLFRAINLYDTPVIVGSTVIYAYLLAVTLFLLDIIYALVDPRVRIGEGSRRL
jgi:peptide/nickel transport system permease protein